MWESFYSRTLTPSAAVVHKVKIHFFSIFFRASIVRLAVRHQGGWLLRQLCLLGWRFCPADRRRENNVIMTLSPDWNPAIPLVKRIFLVPDHIWPKTIKGQPALTHVIRNYMYVLLLVVPPLCLWWVTHTVTKALRLKILPGQLLPLFPNPPTLLQWNLKRNSYIFIKKKCIWKYHLWNGGNFVSASMC